MGSTLKRCEALHFFAVGRVIVPEGPLGKEHDGQRQHRDQDQGTTVGNEPVVAGLPPGFTCIGQT